MALPKWRTPAGNLGTVSEQQFYDYVLEATDPSGGTLVYEHISGRLPLGVQVVESGRLQGVPVSEAGGERNVEYTFTVRAKNEIDFVGSISGTTLTVTSVGTGSLEIGQTLERTGILPRTRIVSLLSGAGGVGTYKLNQPQSLASGNFIATSGVADRTFTLAVTNVAPPIIYSPTRNSFIGYYLDGTELDITLEALEFTPGIDLEWSLVAGELPEGLSLSSTGQITGFIYPIEATGPGTTPGWDATEWALRGWDFPAITLSQTFSFTVQVTDGLIYDRSVYTLLVLPKAALTADTDIITADLAELGEGVRLTVDAGTEHAPIITTKQSDFISVRQSTFYSFNLEAIDLEDDIVWWAFNNASSGLYDEQSVIVAPYAYVPRQLQAGRLTAGLFPKASAAKIGLAQTESISTQDFTNINLEPGANVKIINGANNFEVGVVDNTTTIRLIGNIRLTPSIGQFVTQQSSLANATIITTSATTGNINLRGNIVYGNIVTEVPTYQISTWGNISANVGDTASQPAVSANAVVISRTGFLSFNPSDIGTLGTIKGGDIITQPSTGANAYVLATPDLFYSNAIFYVNYITANSFVANTGNVTFTRGNVVTSVNSYPISGNVIQDVLNVRFTSNVFIANAGSIFINGVTSSIEPKTVIKDANTQTFTANRGDVVQQQGTSGNAIVAVDINDAATIPLIIINGNFDKLSGNLILNGANTSVWVKEITANITPFYLNANVGEYITQTSTGANARITSNVIQSTVIPVEFLSGNFDTSSNLQLNSANITAFPSKVTCVTDLRTQYNTASTFDLNFPLLSGQVLISGTPTFANVAKILDVGVSLTGLIDEGTVGFDEGRYDQGNLSLPPGLTINQYTGWITGQLPALTVNRRDYQFEVVAYKRDDPTYQDVELFTLTVLGDINDRIDWLTPDDLGTIQNGKVSDLYISAVHITSEYPKTLFYEFKPQGRKKLPQGLTLLSTGLIVGRVTFQTFLLDNGTTTIDGEQTTFDETYQFTVEARDVDRTIATERTFTIRVLGINKKPYENLYLKAFPSVENRQAFRNLLQNTDIFPNNLLYRIEDPWFGIAKEIRTLFLPGLNPSTLAEYTLAAELNHFTKRLTFGQIKTARALDTNFETKYEVVYVELKDENTTIDGKGPADQIDLTAYMAVPYYDRQSNSFTIAYPNSFTNMQSQMSSEITYANKGALPDWMTSRQPDGRILGFVKVLVLAYCKPGASDTIAYRLRKYNFDFNQLDFTIDRYLLDNVLSDNYDVDNQAFVTSNETTFDRYPIVPPNYIDAGTVTYAVSDSFESIHNQLITTIKAPRADNGLDGLDGVRNFKEGDTLVFFEQEFEIAGSIQYDNGWAKTVVLWDDETWDYDQNTASVEDDQGWNEGTYVPGFIENNLDPTIANQRMSVWRITFNGSIVQLVLDRVLVNYNKVFVKNGRTYGATNMFFDPIIKSGSSVPTWTIIRQQVSTTYTTFDQNTTRFYDNRDQAVVPGEGDKYIKFTKNGVFT